MELFQLFLELLYQENLLQFNVTKICILISLFLGPKMLFEHSEGLKSIYIYIYILFRQKQKSFVCSRS